MTFESIGKLRALRTRKSGRWEDGSYIRSHRGPYGPHGSAKDRGRLRISGLQGSESANHGQYYWRNHKTTASTFAQDPRTDRRDLEKVSIPNSSNRASN